jgi:hypothetical protein
VQSCEDFFCIWPMPTLGINLFSIADNEEGKTGKLVKLQLGDWSISLREDPEWGAGTMRAWNLRRLKSRPVNYLVQ